MISGVSRLRYMKNKQLESIHFKFFRRLHEDLPEGEVWHEDKPDFWIHSLRGIVGVEHCLVHIPNNGKTPLQAIESQTDEIISLAQEHAELRGLPEIHATFLFNLRHTLKKKERLNLAREITRAIYNKLKDKKDVKPSQYLEIRRPNSPEHVSSIRFIKVEEEFGHFWRCARAGWVVEDCKTLFQDTINKKSDKLPTYLKHCKECWLLMVAKTKPSGFIHPNQKSLDHIYNSPFNRTYFLDTSLRKLYLLKTKNDSG